MSDTDHTGSDDRSHKDTCPKHVGCLPESCGDCPHDEQDASDATSNMQETHAFAKRFPELVGHVGTHYPGCFKAHPACAWRVGFEDGAQGQAECAGCCRCNPSACAPDEAPGTCVYHGPRRKHCPEVDRD